MVVDLSFFSEQYFKYWYYRKKTAEFINFSCIESVVNGMQSNPEEDIMNRY